MKRVEFNINKLNPCVALHACDFCNSIGYLFLPLYVVRCYMLLSLYVECKFSALHSFMISFILHEKSNFTVALQLFFHFLCTLNKEWCHYYLRGLHAHCPPFNLQCMCKEDKIKSVYCNSKSVIICYSKRVRISRFMI